MRDRSCRRWCNWRRAPSWGCAASISWIRSLRSQNAHRTQWQRWVARVAVREPCVYGALPSRGRNLGYRSRCSGRRWAWDSGMRSRLPDYGRRLGYRGRLGRMHEGRCCGRWRSGWFSRGVYRRRGRQSLLSWPLVANAVEQETALRSMQRRNHGEMRN